MPVISHTFVCPHDRDLLGRLQGQRVVINVDSLEESIPAFEGARAAGAQLLTVRCLAKAPLAEMEFPPELSPIPVALYCPGMGAFARLAPRLPVLRSANLRVYLGLDDPEACRSARILSSLGIATVLQAGTQTPRWEELADLMTYAVLGRAAHAPVEPFAFLMASRGAAQRRDFGRVYFDDPDCFLHLEAQGRVALSESDLHAGLFVAESVDRLGDLAQVSLYQERLKARRRVFQRFDDCAVCPAWRICLGRFGAFAGSGKGCRSLFMELLELMEKSFTPQPKTLWPL